MADFARTSLMMRMGELPPGTSTPLRMLTVALRGVLFRSYLRAYRRAGSLDDRLAAAWEPVRAADRLAEGVEGERDRLLDLCRRGLGIESRPGPGPS